LKAGTMPLTRLGKLWFGAASSFARLTVRRAGFIFCDGLILDSLT